MVAGKAGVSVYVATYYGGEARAEYFVDDPEVIGLAVRDDVRVTEPRTGPMTDEQRAERKELIANNKEWDAAETVRREWLVSLIARKSLPKDATVVVATGLAAARSLVGLSMERGNSMAARLLGLEEPTGGGIDRYLTTHTVRAGHVALAIVLGGIEEATSRDSWRSPRRDVAWYLGTLASWGYPLTPVEAIAASISQTAEL